VRLIGLCGAAGSGKDTAASYLAEDGWTRVAFADPLKAVLYDMDVNVWDNRMHEQVRLQQLVNALGWDYTKKNVPEVRGLLQRLGVAVRDHVSSEAWLDAAFKNLDFDKNYVFTDARFPNECEKIQKYGRSALVRIDRPGQDDIAGNHISETAWREAKFDHVIYNTGTPDELGQIIRRIAASA
jgi:hypothetical protein